MGIAGDMGGPKECAGEELRPAAVGGVEDLETAGGCKGEEG